jgi:hypothetical protein
LRRLAYYSGIARFWLKEMVASAPADLVAEVMSLTVMTGGIVALAHRAPHVAAPLASSHNPPAVADHSPAVTRIG